ncbi:MAG TPA: DUF72 domain-containing protein [bacterium]|nr:DUF72 domain-containing protein [bacterium]
MNIPERIRPYLRIGTCSWKFDSWKGLYYDPGKTYGPDDYLRDYAHHLNSVEIDQWFWSLFPGSIKLPVLGTVQNYAQSVPEDFIFTVKAPNSLTLTHYYSKQPPRYTQYAGKSNPYFFDTDLLIKFLDLLDPLQKKLGPVMFQFEYLNKKKMPSQQDFQKHLHRFISSSPEQYEYAVEIRNPNYLNQRFFDFLKDHRLGFVYLDGYYMPSISEVYQRFNPQTAAFNIIRLHGGDRAEIEKITGSVWNNIISPKPAGLKAAAHIVKENTYKEIVTYVNINNHYEGSAPLTVERFKETVVEEFTRNACV